MSVMMMARSKHAHQIDSKAKTANDQKLVCIHIGWVNESLDRLKDNEDGDQNQEDTICKSRQCLHAGIA